MNLPQKKCVDVREPIRCEGCGCKLPREHTVLEDLHMCDKCAELDEQESEVNNEQNLSCYDENEYRDADYYNRVDQRKI